MNTEGKIDTLIRVHLVHPWLTISGTTPGKRVRTYGKSNSHLVEFCIQGFQPNRSLLILSRSAR
jgi:hypothetical protein